MKLGCKIFDNFFGPPSINLHILSYVHGGGALTDNVSHDSAPAWYHNLHTVRKKCTSASGICVEFNLSLTNIIVIFALDLSLSHWLDHLQGIDKNVDSNKLFTITVRFDVRNGHSLIRGFEAVRGNSWVNFRTHCVNTCEMLTQFLGNLSCPVEVGQVFVIGARPIDDAER